MLSKSLNGKNASLMIQVFLVFVWLTDLSVLAGTDTYYSVYLLCGVLGIMALCKRADRKRTLSGKQRFALAIAGGGITLAVVVISWSLKSLDDMYRVESAPGKGPAEGTHDPVRGD